MNINTSIFTMKKYRLKDIATVEISSVDKKTKESETNVRLCNFTDVYYNWAITKDKHDNFMEATANNKEISRFLFKKGQVALTKDSETRYDIGIATYIADDFEDVVLGYHCALITPDESKVVGCYLNAFLHSNMSRKYFANSASGSGQRYTLSIQTIEEMPILLPEIEEQKQIGELFSNIDRKIEINRAINRNLEAMARQLYDYWFVQFDFPDENGRPYKSSGGKMVWNEKLKREIPEGWYDTKLSKIANITMGQSPDGSSYNEQGNGILFYQGSTDFGMRFPSIRLFTTSPTRFAKEGDILMSVRAPVGATNIANADCCIGRGLAAMNSKLGSITHLYHIIQDLKTAFDLRNDAGTTFGSITKDDLYNLVVLKPTKSILELYENICNPIFKQQMLVGRNIVHLIKQRDELLPLLMNGQVNCDL